MEIIKGVKNWLRIRNGDVFAGRSVGFVPTMGALHEGHLSLLRRAKAENDVSVASVFVNPTQFNDPKDLERYPRTLAADAKLLEQARTDYLLVPTAKEMYPHSYNYRVNEKADSLFLCGAHRPGHFEGVLTVVLKLLNLVRADRAYFGEKDYQQYRLIRGMAEAFFLQTAIIPCPTVRESDGLAMSSRNRLLQPGHRLLAPEFARLLRTGRTAARIKKDLATMGFEPDYVEERWGRRFAAAKLGKVRLIDNVEI